LITPNESDRSQSDGAADQPRTVQPPESCQAHPPWTHYFTATAAQLTGGAAIVQPTTPTALGRNAGAGCRIQDRDLERRWAKRFHVPLRARGGPPTGQTIHHFIARQRHGTEAGHGLSLAAGGSRQRRDLEDALKYAETCHGRHRIGGCLISRTAIAQRRDLTGPVDTNISPAPRAARYWFLDTEIKRQTALGSWTSSRIVGYDEQIPNLFLRCCDGANYSTPPTNPSCAVRENPCRSFQMAILRLCRPQIPATKFQCMTSTWISFNMETTLPHCQEYLAS